MRNTLKLIMLSMCMPLFASGQWAGAQDLITSSVHDPINNKLHDLTKSTVQAAATVETVSLAKTVKGNLDAELPVVVVVDQNSHTTHVLQYHHGTVFDVFSIRNATGKPSTPTPNTRARIIQKELNPSWKPPRSIDAKQTVVPPFIKTHKNPLGLANLRLNIDHGMIALHGTNEPRRIGQSVSHGCIRHHNKDIVALYKLVRVGTPVYIVAKADDAEIPVNEFRNEATATAHTGTTANGTYQSATSRDR